MSHDHPLQSHFNSPYSTVPSSALLFPPTYHDDTMIIMHLLHRCTHVCSPTLSGRACRNGHPCDRASIIAIALSGSYFLRGADFRFAHSAAAMQHRVARQPAHVPSALDRSRSRIPHVRETAIQELKYDSGITSARAWRRAQDAAAEQALALAMRQVDLFMCPFLCAMPFLSSCAVLLCVFMWASTFSHEKIWSRGRGR